MNELTPPDASQVCLVVWTFFAFNNASHRKNKWVMCTIEQQSVHNDSPSSLRRVDAVHGNDASNVDAYRANH